MLRGLYVITDEKLTPYEKGKIYELTEKALSGGAKIVQLRDKGTPDEALLPIALGLKTICKDFGALFIVNDRLELAKRANADGLHIGRDDISPEIARKELPNKVIGLSCYGDIERAKWAESLGIDYVAFGSFFPSPTKPESKIVSKDIIRKAKETLKIPICAIGGITLERAEELIALGVDMIAVISDIWLAEDIEERARGYLRLFEKYKSLRT